MAEFLLGIDAGGTAIKVGVFTRAGTEVASAAFTPRQLAPAPGHAERDPEELWLGLCRIVPEALARAGIAAGDIAVVGLTGHGNGLFLVDAAGRPLMNEILAPDIRAAAHVDRWRAAGLEEVTLTRGMQALWAGLPAAILAWLRDNRPEILADAAAMLICKDYLRLRLTGRMEQEVTDLSTACLLSPERRFDPELLGALGLGEFERLIAPRIESLTVAGGITRAAAEALGLAEGTPVAAGVCDNVAVMYGTGAVDASRVVVMSGTWGLHQSFIPRPQHPGPILIAAQGARPGDWLAIEGSPTSASSLEWFVESMLKPVAGATAGPGDFYALCNALVEATTDDGPPVIFLPFLAGAIDCSSARGSFLGLSSWHRLGHAVRGVYEGVAFEHRRHFERLMQVRPPVTTARFAGGAARSAAWSRIFAAALGLELEIPHGAEFGARGAALIAAVSAGLIDADLEALPAPAIDRRFSPDPDLARILDRRFQTYCRLVAALAPEWKELAA